MGLGRRKKKALCESARRSRRGGAVVGTDVPQAKVKKRVPATRLPAGCDHEPTVLVDQEGGSMGVAAVQGATSPRYLLTVIRRPHWRSSVWEHWTAGYEIKGEESSK